jgi:hypothetical protein
MEHGKITKLNAWKSGKGSFIGIDGKEFVILAATDAKIGDMVEYEIGTKFFSGKSVLSKLLLPLESYVQPPTRDEDNVRSPVLVPFRSHYVPKPDAGENYSQAQGDAVKRAENVRLECLACATQVYSGAQGADEKILELAAKFEAYAHGKQ